MPPRTFTKGDSTGDPYPPEDKPRRKRKLCFLHEWVCRANTCRCLRCGKVVGK